MSTLQKQLEPLNIKVDRELKMKLRLSAKDNHRSIQGQVLFFLERGLSHLCRVPGSKSPRSKKSNSRKVLGKVAA